MRGYIKSYLPEKKYGFITGDDKKDYFFHSSSLKDLKDVEKLASGLYLEYEQKATPKGYAATNITIINKQDSGQNAKKYTIPETIYTSKFDYIKGWETIQFSDWEVHGSSRDSPDDAKESMINGAKAVGANCVLNMKYYKTTGSESGTGRGVHYYTIHNFYGIASSIAKLSADGEYKKEDFNNINKIATQLKQELSVKTESSGITRIILWIVNILLIYVCFNSKESSGFVVAIILGILGLMFIRANDYDSWLKKI